MADWRATALLVALGACLLAGGGQSATGSAWQAFNIEREDSNAGRFASPALIARAKLASQSYNAIPQYLSPQNPNELIQLDVTPYASLERDLFECVEPTRELFSNFSQLYGRQFEDDSEKLERLALFSTTVRRIILMNRIVQNAILNQSNYQLRPTFIGDYHFISPLGADNAPSWYADITDCELGLMKKFIFGLFFALDENDYDYAFKLALNNIEFLNIFEADVFEQVSNVLLVKLFDRFRGDDKMNQLFRWPVYMKKLAAYAYNRQQTARPDYYLRLPYIKFAYPAFFKDVRYNLPAINRTGDNVGATEAHAQFNQRYGRKIIDRFERNRRLAIFRQRWTYLNQLNEAQVGIDPLLKNITIEPEWISAARALSQAQIDSPSTSYDFGAASAKLIASELNAAADSPTEFRYSDKFEPTRYSDLTDEEFVAFLNNDFSILGNDLQANMSAQFIEDNLPVRPLSNSFRNELAAELEIRLALGAVNQATDAFRSQQQQPSAARSTFKLARAVVDELIGDVGLPAGSTSIDSTENEHYTTFNRIANNFKKTYYVRSTSRLAGELSESDLLDERTRRYEEFKRNYGRFKAWFVRAGWSSLTEDQAIALMRLADMSWHDIKLTLFKVCCLTEQNLAILGAQNASLQYLASNTEFLCQSMEQPDSASMGLHPGIPPQSEAESTNYAALELYYYYSVHFNKHFVDTTEFQHRFSTFRSNIEQIRRHSCIRGLTVFNSLRTNSPQAFSSIDSLDPRRSHTDDLNLDRFSYFSVPNPAAKSRQQQEQSIRLERLRQLNDRLASAGSGSSSSRAGLSYRRGPPYLTALIDQQTNQRPPVSVNYAEKLTSLAANANEAARKYQANKVDRIYQLVVERYKACVRFNNKEPPSNLRQQCQSSGPLADKANEWTLGALEFVSRRRLTDERSLGLSEDQCAIYRMGLEPWSEGLIPQDHLSPSHIQQARCHEIANIGASGSFLRRL